VELSFLTAVPSFGAIDCTTGRGQPLRRASEAVLSYSVLIVDDSGLIRHSLRCCLEQDPDWRVCGEAEDGKVAVEKVKQLHPDMRATRIESLASSSRRKGRINRGRVPPENVGTDITYGRVCCYSAFRPRPVEVYGDEARRWADESEACKNAIETR
jgi:hypothetical protein